MAITRGARVIVIYTAVFLVVSALVIYTVRENSPSIGTDTYYHEQEGEVEEEYDSARLAQISNSQSLPWKMKIEHIPENQVVEITYPYTGAEGIVKLYNPENGNLDQVMPVTPNTNNQQVLSTQGLVKGNWTVEVQWNVRGVDYLDELEVTIE